MKSATHSLGLAALVGALFFVHLVPAGAEEGVAFVRVAKLTASDGDFSDYFGEAVTISGDTVVVGARATEDYAGSVYVQQRDYGGPDAWGEVVKLTAADAEAWDVFGVSVALDGDTLVVGAYGDADFGDYSGSAYIFERDVGGAHAWGQVAKLTVAEGDSFDFFGNSVGISGDTVAVGAYGDDDLASLSGAIYVFERDSGGPDVWGQVAKLTASDGEECDRLGWSVAISGDSVVAGTYEDGDFGDSAGSAYIFERNVGGLDAWGQVAKLTAGDGESGDQFGWAVAIEGDTVVVGADEDDDLGMDSGSVYVFERGLVDSDVWAETAKITAAAGEAGDAFGASVAFAGESLVIGAWGARGTGPSSGSAYVFQRDFAGSSVWGEVAEVIAPDGEFRDFFGFSVAGSGDTIVAGVWGDDDLGGDSGSAYVFLETPVDPMFALEGACPGEATLTISGATPGGLIRLWGASNEGAATLPLGPCVGTELGLENPTSLLYLRADAAGARSLVRTLREEYCGGFVQLLDGTSCAVSSVVQLPFP